MAIGPLEEFSFPGTYTRTFTEAPKATAAGAQRYAALIGVGPEEERVEGFEMVRGSSATAANIILGEVALENGRGNIVDGVNVDFYVRHYPIVINDGQGTYATQPSDVIVAVNGENVPVQSVSALDGKITLVNPPSAGDLVVLNYYFKRRDLYVENEDQSTQADGSTTIFKVGASRIVTGDNGGNSATSSIIDGSTGFSYTVKNEIKGLMITVPILQVLVNGEVAAISAVSGAYGTFTLATAPAAGSEVLVSYFRNDWQNTFDILPAAYVANITQVGFTPGRTDFKGDVDYVLANENEIHWGNSFSITAGANTSGTSVFGPNQVAGSQVDYRYYMIEATASASSSKQYILPYAPVNGDGTGTPMTSPNNNTASTYDDLVAYVGVDEEAAKTNPVTVVSISGSTITLRTAPATGMKVFVSYFVNKLTDDTWTITNKVSGDTGVGKYTVIGSSLGNARQVVLDSASTSTATFLDTGVVVWDGVAGTSNAYINPSRVFGDETITVTVDAAGEFIVTSNVATGTGSGTVNTGLVGKTYIDPITGFTFALATATAGTLIFKVTKTFTILNQWDLSIPGIRLSVTDTTAVGTSDTAILDTFNLVEDTEPSNGDNYYVTFDKEKIDYSAKYVTSFPEVVTKFGALAQNNPIVMGAYLYFKNGGQALVIKQVKKATGSNDASVSSYIEAIDIFNEPVSNGTRPSLISVMSTNRQVINYLKSSNAQQSSIRFQNERTSYAGVAAGTVPEDVLAYAKALSTELITLVYPDSAIMTIPDSNGVDQDILVGGEYIAVALTGADVSPTYDIATPLTGVQLVGLSRLGRVLTKATAALVAQNGVTVMEYKNNVIRVMMGLTTDLTSPLTRDPRIIEVKHFVQQGVREVCDKFIGRKNIGGITNEIKTALVSYFNSLKGVYLIGGFDSNMTVEVDANDPTIVNVAIQYKPIFGVNWIMVTHYLRSTL